MKCRFRPRPALPSLSLALLTGLALTGPTAGGQTAGTVERDMFVSVLDRTGAPVLTLAPGDFVVREDGRVREVLRARRATDTIELALLIDTSQAAAYQLGDLRQALGLFVETMRPAAHIALIGMGERPTVLTEYTSDAELLKKGLGRVFHISGSGATSLEAVEETLTGLAKRPAERAAVVVVWLGGIEFSNTFHDSVLARLKEDGVPLHVITVGSGVPPDISTSAGRQRELLFDRGTTETGGRRDNVLSSMGLPKALETLAAELLGQYRITYARPESLIPPERIEVSVRPPDLTARGIPVRASKGPK
ncbi:MAG: VWA domain-containing protein [Acidobacteriota bacterium]